MADAPHILVVDDEPDMCWALENILKREGYRITSVMSGKKALRLTKVGDFKIAFIDVRLPDIEGIRLSQLISEVAPEIQVILISGYLYQDDNAVQVGLKEGAYVGFVGKPFDLDEIRLAVEKALGNVQIA